MNAFNIKEMTGFSSDRILKTVFYEQGNLKAQIMCLSAGQVIPPCRMDHDVLFYVVEGQGEITIDNESQSVIIGHCVIAPKSADSRGIRAMTDLVILAVQGRA